MKKIVTYIYNFFKKIKIVDRGRTNHFFRLGLWSGGYPADIFEYFTIKGYGSFSPEKQKQLKKEEIFSNEEFSLLENIYNLMIDYQNNCLNMFEVQLTDHKAKEIESLIIKFLNLSSMKKDFDIIKKGEFYDGFAG